eukprot:comp13226_c0_seq1/m.8599 comp13226_c0_seq1/g.8599  ORF comp13226_c0_seq1/g.8599 comp13226_c0_seq1/m.8599 type:complete len:156 (-) comp13226_c0_seq1:203-670(-)
MSSSQQAADVSRKYFCCQLQGARKVSDSPLRWALVPAAFRSVWLQGDIVGRLQDGHTFVLDDGSGAVLVDLAWLTKAVGDIPVKKKGSYIMVAGQLQALAQPSPTTDADGIPIPKCSHLIRAFKCVDMSQQPERSTLWNMEVVLASKVLGCPSSC